MANVATVKFLGAFDKMRKPLMFLSSFFKTERRDYFNSTSVEIHVRRHGQRVAVALQGMTSDPRWSDVDKHSVKVMTPYSYNEGFEVNGADVMNAGFGKTQYDEPSYMRDALLSFADNGVEKEYAIQRAVELQTSEILQTGTVTLIDSNGDTIGALDFKPKATHFPQVSVSWATIATATPLADMESLADVIRKDSGVFPSIAIMGGTAFGYALQTTEFQKALDNRRMNLGIIMPSEINSDGAKYQGDVHLGSYRVEIWTYPESYDHIQTGVDTPYIALNNVVMLSPKSQFKLAYGGFPSPLAKPDPRVSTFLNVLPRRVSRSGFVDLNPIVWCSEDGQSIKGAVRSRPLAYPVGIDEYGCINTVQA